MVLGSALDIFSREGFSYLSRWSHVFVGITWIGLLYFFNFVQVPAYAQMEASARNNAIDKLTSRALWWFRWAAAATLVSGVALLFIDPKELYKSDFMKSAPGVAIYAGILLAVTMFLNVWLVIWPNQKKVIANARNVQAGGEADPAAAPAARKALMASRLNMIYSLPMLIFMVGTSHFPYDFFLTTGSSRAIFWVIWIVIWGVLELNALAAWDRRMLMAASVCLAVNWFGDSLDGTLARYRDRQRPRYGFYLDHIIDTYGALFLLFGLALSGYMSERVAGGLLIAYFMLAINSYLAAYSLRLFKISQWKMGPTEMRLLLMIGNVFLIYHPRTYHQRYLLYDFGGVIAIIGMAFILVILTIQHTHALYKLERLPKQ